MLTSGRGCQVPKIVRVSSTMAGGAAGAVIAQTVTPTVRGA